MSIEEEVVRKISDRRAIIGVIGLGYVGLRLACSFAEVGFCICGFDTDASKIQQLRLGRSYIGHIPSARIAELVADHRLGASYDFDALNDCDAAIICVPTPLYEDQSPDLQFVVDAANAVRSRLHRGELVVLQSTSYPGTTEEWVLPIMLESGLEVGRDFFLAFSPEREDQGNTEYDTRTTPRLVAGQTPSCQAVAVRLYRQIVDHVVAVSSTQVAEAAKLLENIYRWVNIGMVNELKMLFERMGLNIWEIIQAASTKPFGFTPFYPGPGLGGHCVPVDPFYLAWKARRYGFSARFIELAGDINSIMPEYTVERVRGALKWHRKPLQQSRILVLGVAYKRDTDDIRASPALAIIELLEAGLAHVQYHDPHVSVLRSRYLPRDMSSVELTPKTVFGSDCVVIVTDHRNIDYAMVLENAKLVIDTRNVTALYRKRHDNVVLA